MANSGVPTPPVASGVAAVDNAAPQPLLTPPTETLLGNVAPTKYAFPLAVGACPMHLGMHSACYSFRAHPRISEFLKIFSFVELRTVKATIYQTSLVSAAVSHDSAYKPRVFRHGVAPRGLDGAPGGTNIVSDIPNLHTFITSAGMAASQTLVFGDGGMPFPPGVQVDLKAAEIRHSYAEYFVGLVSPITTSDRALIAVQLDFVVECSGMAFGAP
jgi:hypothetical protein